MPPKWKQRLHTTWRRTSGAAPDAVKAARPVLNGGREETCRKVTRLAPTQRRGGGDQTGHLYINHTTSRPLKKGRMFPKSALRALCAGGKILPRGAETAEYLFVWKIIQPRTLRVLLQSRATTSRPAKFKAE